MGSLGISRTRQWKGPRWGVWIGLTLLGIFVCIKLRAESAGSDAAPVFGPGCHFVDIRPRWEIPTAHMVVVDPHGDVVADEPFVALDDFYRHWRCEFDVNAPVYQDGSIYQAFVGSGSATPIQAGSKRRGTPQKGDGMELLTPFRFSMAAANDSLCGLPKDRSEVTLRALRHAGTLALSPTVQDLESVFEAGAGVGALWTMDPADRLQEDQDVQAWITAHWAQVEGPLRDFLSSRLSGAHKVDALMGIYIRSGGAHPEAMLAAWGAPEEEAKVLAAFPERFSARDIVALCRAMPYNQFEEPDWAELAQRSGRDPEAMAEIRRGIVFGGSEEAAAAQGVSADAGCLDAAALWWAEGRPGIDSLLASSTLGEAGVLRRAAEARADGLELPRTLKEMGAMEDGALLGALPPVARCVLTAYEDDALMSFIRSRRSWLQDAARWACRPVRIRATARSRERRLPLFRFPGERE